MKIRNLIFSPLLYNVYKVWLKISRLFCKAFIFRNFNIIPSLIPTPLLVNFLLIETYSSSSLLCLLWLEPLPKVTMAFCWANDIVWCHCTEPHFLRFTRHLSVICTIFHVVMANVWVTLLFDICRRDAWKSKFLCYKLL